MNTVLDPGLLPGDMPWPPDRSIRYLTLWEPWATAIPAGLKGVETRGYGSPFRGWLMIHAGTHRLTKLERASLPPVVKRAMIDLPNNAGHVVAIARVADIVPTEKVAFTGATDSWRQVRAKAGPAGTGPTILKTQIGVAELPWGLYEPGRYAWLLANIVALPEPIPMTGSLGLKTPPLEVLEAVQHQIGAMTRG